MTGLPRLADVVAAVDGYRPDALPVAHALAVIERMCVPIDAPEPLPVANALDRVLARDVVSPIDVPAHDNTAMDGWAVRAADLAADRPTVLRAVGAALAGSPFRGEVGPGDAVRVMTGAVIPTGCDTVVVQELARADGQAVTVPPGQQAGQHVRRRGEDLAAGRPALRAGRRIGPAELGLLASLGVADVPVQRRLRVAHFSTGDELRSIGEPLEPGCVYDSNRYTLHGMLARLGVEAIDLGIVRDSPEALEAAMRRAAGQADAIVSSGGVSVGEADFTRAVLDRLGEVSFWTIAMRPGRPMAFGRIGSACYFGLPGNPVAVMVTFCFLVRDALIRLSGAEPRPLLPLRVRTVAPLRKKPGRTEYQRAVAARALDGTLAVHLTGAQGSGVLRSMSEANCIVVLPHDQGDVEAGDWVDAVPFDGLL
jgi:molybdopterin molybdotransferase